MNDWQSNYSPSLASTFGPWYPTTTKNRMIKTQHTHTLTLQSNNFRTTKTTIPKRRAISVQRRLPTPIDAQPKTQKLRTLPEPILMNLQKEPLFVRSNKMVQDILKKLQHYRFNERHLIS